MSADQIKQLLEAMRVQSDAIQQLMGQTPQNAASASLNHANLASSIDGRISKFNYDAETGNTFEQWFKRFGVLIEEDGKDLPESTKVRLLLGKLGDEEYGKYRDSISPTQPDKVTWVDSITKLKGLYAETRSLFVRRYECFKISQQPSQDISSLVAHINASCENANLSPTKEQLKCIILVIALNDEHHDLRQKCLKMLEDAEKTGTDITLQKVEEELKAIQIVKESALSLLTQPVSTSAIQLRPQQWQETSKDKHKAKPAPKWPHHEPAPKSPHHVPSPKQKSDDKANRGHPSHPCASCGSNDHWRSDCKFANAFCNKCNRQGHIAIVCRQRSSNTAHKSQNRSFHTVVVKSHCMVIGTTQGRWWKIPVTINGINLKMNGDSGAQATVISFKTWIKLGQPKLSPTDIETRNCNYTAFSTEGKFHCTVSCFDRPSKTLIAYVSSDLKHDLFGLPWIEEFELIPREILFPKSTKGKPNASINANVVKAPNPAIGITDESSLTAVLQKDFEEVFKNGLGHCAIKAHLILKPDARPIFCKARPVPHGAIEAVDTELDRLLQIGAIKPVEFSHWAAPILAVKKKNGKTRVCIDFSTGLNDSIELNLHPLPRPDVIYAALNGAAFFSNLELRDAYLQMELDEKSKHLCTINTHRGLFQCQRLPFGVKSAPSIFQHLMDQICAGIPGVFSYLDDCLIASKTLEDHVNALHTLFQRIKDFGLRIQLEKCKFLKKNYFFSATSFPPTAYAPTQRAQRQSRKCLRRMTKRPSVHFWERSIITDVLLNQCEKLGRHWTNSSERMNPGVGEMTNSPRSSKQRQLWFQNFC